MRGLTYPLRTKRRRDSGTLKVMGQELEECVNKLEVWVELVIDDYWLITSSDGKSTVLRKPIASTDPFI